MGSSCRTRGPLQRFAAAATTLALGGCAGPLSTLDPAGPSAASVARLWWVMLAGAGALTLLVLALLLAALSGRRWVGRIGPRVWLIGGGLVLPGVVLSLLLVFALLTGERLLARPGEAGVLEMRAVARQWEWRFGPPGGPFEAGRLVVPAGRPVHVHVESEDVIHSFWIPRLAGKIDAIPGHVNVIRILAEEPGVYRGVCAEYCGSGHTFMDFVVEAVPDTAVAGDVP